MVTEAQAYSQSALLASLMQIHHGELKNYLPVAVPAAKSDPELFAHLVAWDANSGKVKDSKRAMPLIALRGLTSEHVEFAENAVAHLLLLSPRELAAAYRFNHEMVQAGLYIPGGHRRMLEKGIRMYLTVREAKNRWWDSAAVSDRSAMKYLYKVVHQVPSARAQAVLFRKNERHGERVPYPHGSAFEAITKLAKISTVEAGGLIQKFNIPVEVAIGAGVNLKDEQIQLAIVEGMTGNQILNMTGMLKKLGAFDNPKIKAAYDAAVERAKTDKRVNTFRATKAAEVMGADTKEAKKLIAIQEVQEKSLKGIQGDWLVIGDKSGSMNVSIEVTRHIAAALSSQVKGKVYLVYVDGSPRAKDVSGKTFDEILKMTKDVIAGGNTNLGCGLEYAREKNWLVQGIVLVSDGGENCHPVLAEEYQGYVKKFGIEPSLTFFHVPGDNDHFSANADRLGVRYTKYELGKSVDLYSLPGLVRSLKPGRYGLLDEVMEFPLLTFDQVFKKAA